MVPVIDSHFRETSDLDKEIELYEKGVRILRFGNHAVLSNIDGVLNAIIYAIDPEKSLWPPQRSREIGRRNETKRSIPSPQSSP